MKTWTSLNVPALWSRSSLPAERIFGYHRIYQQIEKIPDPTARMHTFNSIPISSCSLQKLHVIIISKY